METFEFLFIMIGSAFSIVGVVLFYKLIVAVIDWLNRH